MNPLQRMKLNSLRKKVKKNNDKREAGAPANIDQEVKILLDLAMFYEERIFDKDVPDAALLAQESYRAAAVLGSAEGQFCLGKLFLERGRFWTETFSSILSSSIQKQYAENCYREGFQYLTSAQENRHALATRLHGMSYVNGWGVRQDLDKGYRMVVKSIDMEGSWDDATKIFEKLGLNSAEFFSALGEIKKERGGYGG